jgi:hypothetical protein
MYVIFALLVGVLLILLLVKFVKSSLVTIVMSVCGNKDDVETVRKLGYPTIVYDKCKSCEGIPDCKVLENVGREQGTWVQYALDNYDNLPEHILFLPAPINKWDRIDRARDMINNGPVEGNPIGEHENFTLNHWNGNDLVPAETRPFRAWYEKNVGPWDPDAKGVHYNGVLRTTRDRIRQRSKDFYQNLHRQLTVHNNLEVAHYMERSTGMIF